VQAKKTVGPFQSVDDDRRRLLRRHVISGFTAAKVGVKSFPPRFPPLLVTQCSTASQLTSFAGQLQGFTLKHSRIIYSLTSSSSISRARRRLNSKSSDPAPVNSNNIIRIPRTVDMTQLLDLPPELFQIIIHKVVAIQDVKQYANGSWGPRNAWKLRGVCRVFAAEIKHDLLTNQPHHELPGCSEIIENNMATYLFRRVQKPLDTRTNLTTIINQMVNYICEVHSVPTARRQGVLEDMCAGLVPIFEARRLWEMFRYADMPVPEAVDRNTLRLTAAVAMRRHDLVRGLISQTPISAEVEIARGRSNGPLVVAAKAGDIQLFRIMMTHLGSLKKMETRSAMTQFDVEEAIEYAL
jgi:hypothetical protein